MDVAERFDRVFSKPEYYNCCNTNPWWKLDD
nr:MAG TPA: hypothetical protein [Caudoviricetes sp.]